MLKSLALCLIVVFFSCCFASGSQDVDLFLLSFKASGWSKLTPVVAFIVKFFEGFSFDGDFLIHCTIDLCGSIMCCLSYRHKNNYNKKSWLEIFAACAVLHFGGKTLTAIILGQTPYWMYSQIDFPMFVVAWWLTFFAPFDLFWKFCDEFPFIEFVFKLFYAIEAGHAITIYGMDLAIWNSNPMIGYKIKNSSFMCLLCGTLSAYGGHFLGDWLGVYRDPSFTISTTPALFLNNRHAASYFYRSLSLSLLYYCLINPSGRMPWSGQFEKVDARLVIVSIQILHICATYVSHNFDVFALMADVFAFEVNSNANIQTNVKDTHTVHNDTKNEKAHVNSQPMKNNIISEPIANGHKIGSDVNSAAKLTQRKKVQ